MPFCPFTSYHDLYYAGRTSPKGLLRWPKSFGTKEQGRFPIIPAALHRARSEVDRALYHKESSFTRNGLILGEGLFSRILFEKGDVVATFKGEIINYKV